MLVLRLDATLVEMVDTTPCDICAQAVDERGDDTDVSCDTCKKFQAHSMCVFQHCSKDPDATNGMSNGQDLYTGVTEWQCGKCCAKVIQPAPPAADEDAEPAPRADSENDESADDAGTEDVGPPPKRARASSLEDCLEELRKKLEFEYEVEPEETFDVNVALAWCDAYGAKKISHIVKAKYVDAFVAEIGLKPIPAELLKMMLEEQFAA